MTNYINIPVAQGPTEIDTSVSETDLQDLQPIDESALPETGEEAQAPVQTQQQIVEKEQRRTSRATKRIKQLLADNRQLEDEVEALRNERDAFKNQQSVEAKQTKEQLKAKLESNIQILNSQLIQAMRANDPENAGVIVELQGMITQSQMELASLAYELKQEAKNVLPKAAAPQVRAPQIPEKAAEWVDEHPQFNSDELFRNAVLTINNQLLRAGWNPESEEFYTELNAVLTPKFPEVFGVQQNVEVQSSHAEPVLPKAPPVSQVRKPTQTMSGAARAPVRPRPQNPAQVVITEEHIRRAESMGVPGGVKRLAERMAHIENNRRQDGYVPIMMKKDER